MKEDVMQEDALEKRQRQRLGYLPRTRAKGRVAILKAVAKAIADEPLRYDQTDWVNHTDNWWFEEDDRAVGPVCGTAGCVAGWTVIMTRPVREKGDPVNLAGFDVSHRAARRLKLTERQTNILFNSDAVGWTPDPVLYATRGVEHIENFLRTELGYKGPKLPRPKKAR